MTTPPNDDLLEDLLNRLPHSRACGILKHDHGRACSPNCQTCHGQEVKLVFDFLGDEALGDPDTHHYKVEPDTLLLETYEQRAAHSLKGAQMDRSAIVHALFTDRGFAATSATRWDILYQIDTAQVQATLAAVEEQRFANIIALAHLPVGMLTPEQKTLLRQTFPTSTAWEEELQKPCPAYIWIDGGNDQAHCNIKTPHDTHFAPGVGYFTEAQYQDAISFGEDE